MYYLCGGRMQYSDYFLKYVDSEAYEADSEIIHVPRDSMWLPQMLGNSLLLPDLTVPFPP